MDELFIYYRAAVADATAVQSTVAAFQDLLRRQHPGLVARLLRRPEADERGLHTWMETYAMPDADARPEVDSTLEAAIAQAARGLDPLLAGPRHVERFLSCAS